MPRIPKRLAGALRHRRRSAGLLLACAGVAAVSDCRGQETPPAPGTTAPPATKVSEPAWLRGQLISRYWLRRTDDTTDQDLYETLLLDFGDEKRDAVTGHLMGRIAADLDGRTNGDAQFFGLNDAVGDDVDGRLYDAYADLHRVPGLLLVRVGRQLIHETPELAWFDGLRAETQPWGEAELQVGVYGGAGTHLYESSASGDWTIGFYGQGRPWRGGRVRLDWMHLEDRALLGSHDNDLLGAGVWQTIGQLQLEGQYTRLEDRDRDVRARAAFTEPEAELLAQVTFYQLLSPQNDLVLEIDPFFNALHELSPYWQTGALLGKGLFEHTELQVGADLRRVDDRSDVGTFNRDYDRWFATLHVRDLPVKGLSIAVTGDVWHSDGQQVSTWGADLGYAIGEATRVSAGSYYSLYKFDLFANSERDHVRTYFGKLQHRASKAWSLDGSYEFEQTDFDDYHALRLGVTWRF